MTTYGVMGVTGGYGRAAVQQMLARGVAATDIVGLARTPEKAAGLGIAVRHLDMDDTSDLADALQGIDRLLFVSAKDIGPRERQHGNVVAAARQAGVRRVVYTSFIGAQDHPENPLTPEHRITEQQLAAAGFDQVVVLRNGSYAENLLGGLDHVLATGTLVGASGDGLVSAAARDDLVEAGVIALVDDVVAPGAHDLVGRAFTKAELARQVGEAAGRPVEYRDLPAEQYREVLLDSGMPGPVADTFAQVEEATAGGAMYSPSTELAEILGREPVGIAEVVRRTLAARA